VGDGTRLTIASQGLFLGLAFTNSENTIQGLQNQSFSIFMLLWVDLDHTEGDLF